MVGIWSDMTSELFSVYREAFSPSKNALTILTQFTPISSQHVLRSRSMRGVNMVIHIGIATREAELRHPHNGNPVSSIAVLISSPTTRPVLPVRLAAKRVTMLVPQATSSMGSPGRKSARSISSGAQGTNMAGTSCPS